tara:strand:- start:380 stop:1489 length:1110 start_codon:yes stop_codon:yes gene_type:complete
MWQFVNPVNINFGCGQLNQISEIIDGRPYALVTYDDPVFQDISTRLQAGAGTPQSIFDHVSPNPSFLDLVDPCERIKEAPPDIIVALGGGSVIDTAKVLALGISGFDSVRIYLESKNSANTLPESAIPIIAVPTTAGTGSEVTKWATVWDTESAQKYSLSREDLYPKNAVIDPELMLALPLGQTISTGLDALSHALESIWNVNANPVSSMYAIAASKRILLHLDKLADDLNAINHRTAIAEAALYAGLAFSNTKTALAHSLSYPLTLHHGVTHGIACSFTLPSIMRSIIGEDKTVDTCLMEIFGSDLNDGASKLEKFIQSLNISTNPRDHGVKPDTWREWISDALDGERGLNFIGKPERVSHTLLAAIS